MVCDSEKLPHDIPYLHADEKRIDEWKNKLEHDTSFKIGICWEAQTYIDQSGKMVKNNRSIPLSLLEPLKNIPGISLYSLQKGTGTEQLKTKPEGLIIQEFGPDFDTTHGRFMDTAAVMKNLDLVLTIDTSIAHLAGALGVPVWNMIIHNSCWRWFRNRTDSPWYPTMRLFRQPQPGDWKSVMQEVIHELEKIVSTRKNTTFP